jgi:hypothetical protein
MEEKRRKNADPITGKPGAHPIGTGVGAASGGVAGAALGAAMGGPIGASVGPCSTCGARGVGQGESRYWAARSRPRDPQRNVIAVSAVYNRRRNLMRAEDVRGRCKIRP